MLKPIRRKPQGYVLLLTVILLLALSMISIKFFSANLNDSKIAGYNRDAEESFQLAESALNLVYGGFVYDADMDLNPGPDNQGVINLDDALPLPSHYMFIVSSSDKIEQTTPSILQRIADGEARASKGNVAGARILPTATTLLLTDLFNTTSAPLIFTPGNTGLQQHKNGHWNDFPASDGKAAAWIEITRDAFQVNRLYLFAQTMAQVGKSKSYLQRYIGEYSDVLGNNVWALTEANPNPSAQP